MMIDAQIQSFFHDVDYGVGKGVFMTMGEEKKYNPFLIQLR